MLFQILDKHHIIFLNRVISQVREEILEIVGVIVCRRKSDVALLVKVDL